MNKPFVCPSAVLPGLALVLGAWRPGSFSFRTTTASLALAFSPLWGQHLVCKFVCVCVVRSRVARSFVGGLIMHGLGKTERGETGRDIDLTSLRSTMPAGGQLQVSAPEKKRVELKERGQKKDVRHTGRGYGRTSLSA